MKKVVWAYADWTEEGKHDLAISTYQQYMLVASPISWMKYAPTFRRVFYVDKSIYSFLEQKNLLRFWDEVIVVDFKKEIVGRFNAHFFAYPKMWAFTQQEDPFFICDTDVVLTRPLKDWFNENECSGWLYNHTDNLPLGNSEREQEFSADDFVRFEKACTATPGLRSFCDFTNSVNGGMIYFPDPKKAQILGYTMLGLASEIQKAPGNWVIYEEALIPTLMKTMGVNMVPQPFDTCRIEECDMDSVENHSDVCEMIENNLKVDIMSIYLGKK